MRFAPCLHKRRAPVTPDRDEPSEATVARIKAEVDLARVKARTPAIRALGDSLRELRTDNHLAQAFESAFQKGRTT